MDDSKQFIKQCEKAEEVQEQWAVYIGNNWYVQSGGCVMLFDTKVDGDEIWLPRQDQLQEMVGYQIPSGTQLQLFFAFTLTQKRISMEQLWLAFVMKEKYGKVWNGEEWVKPVAVFGGR